MAWVGWLVILFVLITYWGSWLQWKTAGVSFREPRLRKAYRGGVLVGVAFVTVILWGVLAIGTGHL